VKVASVGLLLFAVGVFLFSEEIMRIFRDDADVILIGNLALRFQCLTFPFMGWVILNNMMMQTIGDVAKASLLALARQGLFLLPILFTLVPLMGLLGLQLSQPAADFATFLFSIPIGLGVLRKMSKNESKEFKWSEKHA
jgi:Na+-driven multidrug efflux pump